MRLLVTGGCGFVGSNFIRYVLGHYQPESITNVDALTYAGSLSTTADLPALHGDRYEFVHADIADREKMDELLSMHTYYGVINFAAETHVDRSIRFPQNFVRTNIVGVTVLLEAARRHGVKRFLQVSTDEVYGSRLTGRFDEESPLRPSSPYSASKAAADLLVLANYKTFEQDVVITRSSNNFGLYQFPEKLIPVVILRALENKPVPIYGTGLNVRDWIHVSDHCSALFTVLLEGRSGEIYNIGGDTERTNLSVARQILNYLGKPTDLIEHVEDRLGHDQRYAIDATKLKEQTGWHPLRSFDESLVETIEWYRRNDPWWRGLTSARD
jgi:dTDP-glucose 4,6-dehydratase